MLAGQWEGSVKDSIFISYRVADTGDVNGRIYDYLVQRFGQDHVFKDVQGIYLGVDYRKSLNEALSRCHVLLAVIGPTWLTVTDNAGNRRLDNPEDWVRFEIETALGRNIPVIPLLVKGASLPKKHELPESIKELAYRQGTKIGLNDPDFDKDMEWLIRKLEEHRSRGTNQANQSMIEALEKQKGVLQKQFDKVVQELLYADSSTTVRLEGQRDNLNQKIQEIDQKMNGLRDGI